MDDLQQIIDKIRKLLDLARHANSNESEAALALSKAEMMMRKYQIQMADITSSRLREDDLDSTSSNTSHKRRPSWVWNLAWAAARLTDTKPTSDYKDGGISSVFCGTAADVQVAVLYHDYLVAEVDRLARMFKGTRKDRSGFRVGASQRILERCKVIAVERKTDFAESTGTDLVLIKDQLIEERFHLKYSSPSRRTIGSNRGYLLGAAAGDNVSLDKQVYGTQLKMLDQHDNK